MASVCSWVFCQPARHILRFLRQTPEVWAGAHLLPSPAC